MATLRKHPMIWAKDDLGGSNPCVVCGRPLTSKMFAVHVIDGGSSVLHPEDEAAYQTDGGDMYYQMVGSDCRKRFGDFAVEWKS